MSKCNDNTLDFTVEEMNQILKEAPLNASERFSHYPKKCVYFDLVEVLPLIDEKDRALGKLITFLNHEEPARPELWLFKGKSLSQWFELKKWTSIPLPSMSKLAMYLFSSTIRGIEVVDQAPAAMDNILYLQYAELPDYSTYEFNYLFSGTPEAEKNIVLYVTLFTRLIGKSGYENVRVLFNTVEKPTNSKVVGTVVDQDGSVLSFTDNGWWGPSYGFAIPANYEHTMPFTLNFTVKGYYKLSCQLVNIVDGSIYAEKSLDVNVE